MSREFSKYIKSVCNVLDCITLLQISAYPRNINIVQLYVPTSNHNENELEKFYSDLQSVMIKLKRSDVNIIMGDLNAKVGIGGEEGIVSNFGLGIRNERGERIENFVRKTNYV